MELPSALHRVSPVELKARVEAERRGRPFVVLLEDDGAQRIVELATDRLTVGRDEGCDVSLPWDRETSRVHALLERLHDQWSVVDDGGSRNGSFVNGERVSGRRRLRDGDVLRVGRTAILFRAPEGGDSIQTLPSDDPAPTLTAGQRRVLLEVCRPFAASRFAAPASTRQIAEALVISPDTVKTHLRALFEAFGVEALPQNQKRAELARLALERGVVSRAELT
jgi:pSer/pThr/pTyr-binding forkhead associated (FHA) protein